MRDLTYEEAVPTGHGRHPPLGEENQEELVRAASDLIAERGFEGLRTRDVAARRKCNCRYPSLLFSNERTSDPWCDGSRYGEVQDTASLQSRSRRRTIGGAIPWESFRG